MSISHAIAFRIMMKGKKPFDSSNPIDYKTRRENEIVHKPHKGVLVEQISFNGVPGEILSKKGNAEDKIIFYIHGGGFVGGRSESRRDFTSYLAYKSGINVISVDYRLAPEYKFPIGIKDCLSFYKGLLTKYSPDKICFIGESAGGNLVLALSHLARDNGLPLPKCIVAISPAAQQKEELPSYKLNENSDCMLTHKIVEEIQSVYFEDIKDVDSPYASPLLGDFTNFPPIYITVSKSEVLYDDSVMLYEKLKTQSIDSTLVEKDGLCHAWPVIPVFPEARREIKGIIKFIKSHI